MAEAIACGRFGDRLRAASAGSRPRGEIHPLALATLRDHGLSTGTLRSKSWQEFADKSFDLVLTLCDEAAAEPCPVFPGSPPHAHWSLPDPPLAHVPQAAFREVFETLVEAIGELASGPVESLADRAAAGAALIEERFPTRLR